MVLGKVGWGPSLLILTKSHSQLFCRNHFSLIVNTWLRTGSFLKIFFKKQSNCGTRLMMQSVNHQLHHWLPILVFSLLCQFRTDTIQLSYALSCTFAPNAQEVFVERWTSTISLNSFWGITCDYKFMLDIQITSSKFLESTMHN